jgi:uncharacterized protein YcaQ
VDASVVAAEAALELTRLAHFAGADRLRVGRRGKLTNALRGKVAGSR